MVSRDWRPVKLRAKTELSALVAISAPLPGKLQKMELSPVDFPGELGRVKAALGTIRPSVLGEPGSPFTLDALVEALRGGVDILYLVSHGMFGRATGTPALVLQDEKGEVKVVKGEDLALRLGELQKPPRLVVLASCQSAGDGQPVESAQRSSVQATLAARLADAGVPAIVAMQGNQHDHHRPDDAGLLYGIAQGWTD
jgi:CHAT domain